MIKCGPLVLASNFEEEASSEVNIFTGAYAVDKNRWGVPVDDRGSEILDNTTIFHPRSRAPYRFVLWGKYRVAIPRWDYQEVWNQRNFIEVPPTTMIKYCLKYIFMRNNNPDFKVHLTTAIAERGAEIVWRELNESKN
jgi:hypothetical protein